MGLFDKLLKREAPAPQVDTVKGGVYAPITGQYIPLEQIPDEVFSQGVLGQGCGIEPERYLDGNSLAAIAEEVTTFGVPTRDGYDRWQRRTIRYILENERYAGDSMLQKRFTTDALPYRQKWNHGEKTKYFVPDSNPSIISKEIFEKAQALLKWKARDVTTRCESPHDFTLVIVCNECGSFFKRKVTRGTTYWVSAAGMRRP